MAKQLNSFTRYKAYAKAGSIKEMCKCPRCEKMHLVSTNSPSKIMPRIFCESCKNFRYSDNEGETCMGLGRPAKRKARA